MDKFLAAVSTPLGFGLYIGAVTLWLVGVITASLLYRLRRNKPIFPSVPKDAIFAERTASGASRKNLLTMMGGASNCLIVAVTPDRVTMGPWFPFSLMFLPEIYDLERSIALADIRVVEERRFLFVRSFRLTFADASGAERAVDLRLRDPDGFLEALSRDKRVRSRITTA